MIKLGMHNNQPDSEQSPIYYSSSSRIPTQLSAHMGTHTSNRVITRNSNSGVSNGIVRNRLAHLLRYGWIEFVLALFLAFMVWLVLFLPAQASTISMGPEPASRSVEVATLGVGYSIYLPMSAYNANSPLASGEVDPELLPPTATPEPTPEPSACALNEQEQAVAQLFMNQPEQQRAEMVCDPILAQVARARAADMAVRGYFDHVNPDGHGPNLLVTQAGFILPNWYADAPHANNIESIAAGYTSPQSVWEGWMASPAHRRHLNAADGATPIEFYAEQEAYGIGYWEQPGSPYRYYWVVLTAPQMGD